ncbi:MAG: TonB family protein [Gammaproteobacteria bacterium]
MDANNKNLDKLAGIAVVAVFIAVVAFGLYQLMSSVPEKPGRSIQQISIIKPPPPPPPPKLEEPPEPEIEEPIEEIEPVEETPEAENEPPPGEDLGVDAEGGAGGDGFGLVGKKGGRGLIGGGGSRFGYFAGLLERELQEYLSNNDEVRKKGYSVIVRIWISPDGSVTRSELQGTSGDPEVDDALTAALTRSFRLSERPPEDMPQPVKLRIGASG